MDEIGSLPIDTCQVSLYIYQMIVSFRHKGLKSYYERGDESKLPSKYISKIRLILTRLDAATEPRMMDVPGYGLHLLKGDMTGFWSVKVSGNYRIIFRFENENVNDVDYLDYH
jgi:proteic killer suppression protein